MNSATFMRIIEKRSTESFSGLPYAIALFNCLIYTLYGSPLISNGWDNVVVMVINGICLLLQCCFICIYLSFAPPKFMVLSRPITYIYSIKLNPILLINALVLLIHGGIWQ